MLGEPPGATFPAPIEELCLLIAVVYFYNVGGGFTGGLTIIAVFYLEILDGDFVPYLAKPNDA